MGFFVLRKVLIFLQFLFLAIDNFYRTKLLKCSIHLMALDNSIILVNNFSIMMELKVYIWGFWFCAKFYFFCNFCIWSLTFYRTKLLKCSIHLMALDNALILLYNFSIFMELKFYIWDIWFCAMFLKFVAIINFGIDFLYNKTFKMLDTPFGSG